MLSIGLPVEATVREQQPGKKRKCIAVRAMPVRGKILGSGVKIHLKEGGSYFFKGKWDISRLDTHGYPISSVEAYGSARVVGKLRDLLLTNKVLSVMLSTGLSVEATVREQHSGKRRKCIVGRAMPVQDKILVSGVKINLKNEGSYFLKGDWDISRLDTHGHPISSVEAYGSARVVGKLRDLLLTNEVLSAHDLENPKTTIC